MSIAMIAINNDDQQWLSDVLYAVRHMCEPSSIDSEWVYSHFIMSICFALTSRL